MHRYLPRLPDEACTSMKFMYIPFVSSQGGCRHVRCGTCGEAEGKRGREGSIAEERAKLEIEKANLARMGRVAKRGIEKE